MTVCVLGERWQQNTYYIIIMMWFQSCRSSAQHPYAGLQPSISQKRSPQVHPALFQWGSLGSIFDIQPDPPSRSSRRSIHDFGADWGCLGRHIQAHVEEQIQKGDAAKHDLCQQMPHFPGSQGQNESRDAVIPS